MFRFFAERRSRCLKREGYLWTTGYVPRFRTYPGFETPKPILVELNRGDADLNIVMADVLALTEVNYNACDYVSGLPVTLKFANRGRKSHGIAARTLRLSTCREPPRLSESER